ncbi:hypothetical protein HY480_01200 [Candidatus Uhrbacteria bacterium]|nr:hypothetical protein [Candidatus Uhrbacteria bacterium]
MLDSIERMDDHREPTHPLWVARAQIVRHGRRGFGTVEMNQLPGDVRDFLTWILGEARGASELPGAVALEQKYFDGDAFSDDERATLERWYVEFSQRRAA